MKKEKITDNTKAIQIEILNTLNRSFCRKSESPKAAFYSFPLLFVSLVLISYFFFFGNRKTKKKTSDDDKLLITPKYVHNMRRMFLK